MNNRIKKAQELLKEIGSLEESIHLNTVALNAAKNARASKSVIEELSNKKTRQEKKLAKTQKKYNSYVDENIKVSEFPTVIGKEQIMDEDFENMYDYDDYNDYNNYYR